MYIPCGVGKDTLLAPAVQAVGPWNCSEVSPDNLFEPFNEYLKAVLMRVSEARDIGDVSKFQLYERMKTIGAAPPETLRVNEKKASLPSQPFGMVFRSLKDPDWAPPDAPEAKSKSSFSTGGQGGQGNDPPAPVHMPLELQRAMQQRVQKASLPAGDRALPQAGLIFFPYRGKASGIYSLELTYAGPAGKATLTLQP